MKSKKMKPAKAVAPAAPARARFFTPERKRTIKSWLKITVKYFAMIVMLTGGVIYAIAMYGRDAAMNQLASAIETNTPERWDEIADYEAIQESIASWTIAGMEARMRDVPEGVRAQGRQQAYAMMKTLVTPTATAKMVEKVYGDTPQARIEKFNTMRSGNQRSARVTSVGLTRMRVQWLVRPDSPEVITAVLDRRGFSRWEITGLTLPNGMFNMGLQ